MTFIIYAVYAHICKITKEDMGSLKRSCTYLYSPGGDWEGRIPKLKLFELLSCL